MGIDLEHRLVHDPRTGANMSHFVPGDLVETFSSSPKVSMHLNPGWTEPEDVHNVRIDNPQVGHFKGDEFGLVLAIVFAPWGPIDDRLGQKKEEWCLVLWNSQLGWRESRFFIRAGEYETG